MLRQYTGITKSFTPLQKVSRKPIFYLTTEVRKRLSVKSVNDANFSLFVFNFFFCSYFFMFAVFKKFVDRFTSWRQTNVRFFLIPKLTGKFLKETDYFALCFILDLFFIIMVIFLFIYNSRNFSSSTFGFIFLKVFKGHKKRCVVRYQDIYSEKKKKRCTKSRVQLCLSTSLLGSTSRCANNELIWERHFTNFKLYPTILQIKIYK